MSAEPSEAGPDGTPGEAVEAPRPGAPGRRPMRTVRSVFIQLLVTTLGLLIALSIDGVVERRRQRSLVAEAQATLAQEIADNRKDLAGELAAVDQRTQQISQAMQLVNDLSAGRKSAVTSFSLGFALAELRDAAWQSADRTGALSYMPYAEVASYARIYTTQALFVSHQRRLIDGVAGALAVAVGDPASLSAKDLDTFRQQLMALRANVVVEAQIGAQLATLYESAAVGGAK